MAALGALAAGVVALIAVFVSGQGGRKPPPWPVIHVAVRARSGQRLGPAAPPQHARPRAHPGLTKQVRPSHRRVVKQSRPSTQAAQPSHAAAAQPPTTPASPAQPAPAASPSPSSSGGGYDPRF